MKVAIVVLIVSVIVPTVVWMMPQAVDVSPDKKALPALHIPVAAVIKAEIYPLTSVSVPPMTVAIRLKANETIPMISSPCARQNSVIVVSVVVMLATIVGPNVAMRPCTKSTIPCTCVIIIGMDSMKAAASPPAASMIGWTATMKAAN